MKRLAAGIGVLSAIALGWVWMSWPAPLPALERPAVATGVPVHPPSAVTRPRAAPLPSPAVQAHQRSWVAQVEEVERWCGLSASARCHGDTCATVMVMPDMDHAWGWAQLMASSPTFVMSTAARDLGAPAMLNPCGVAAASLVERGVTAVELPDGTEIWCATDDPSRALCSQIAEEQFGLPGDGFAAENLRQLRF